jgi:hypothetical protein
VVGLRAAAVRADLRDTAGGVIATVLLKHGGISHQRLVPIRELKERQKKQKQSQIAINQSQRARGKEEKATQKKYNNETKPSINIKQLSLKLPPHNHTKHNNANSSTHLQE